MVTTNLALELVFFVNQIGQRLTLINGRFGTDVK